MKSIGLRLKKVLEKKQMSYSEFANAADIHYNSVTRMLNGETSMNSKTLHKVFMVFPDLNARWFITGEGSMMSTENEEVNHVNESETLYQGSNISLDTKIKAIVTNDFMINIIKEALKKYDQENNN